MNRFAWLFVGLLAWGLSFGQAKADIETPVLIYVTVPEDATLEVDGVVVNQKGAERKLITDYKLKIGQKVSYTLTAKFNRDGKPVVVSKVVTVEGGVESRVDLTKAAEVVIPKKEEPKTVLPKVEPKKEEPKKVEPKKEEPKKVEPKKEEMKKEEPKKVEPKKEEPKKVEPKKEEPKKVEPKKEEPKKEPTPAKKEIRLDVPYVPTPEKVVDEMLKLANVTDKDVVYDLGCGDGRIFISAVKKYNAKKGIGLDLNPVRVKESKDNAQKAGVTDKVEIREGDVLKITDLSEASVVTLYLLPDINVKLKPILKKSLKPGSRIVSHDFDMGDDWKPEKEITVKDETGREHTIYLWTIPGAKKEEPKKVEAPKKTEEPKKVEPKKTEEPKKVEPKKTEEPKKVEPKKTEEPKKVKARLDVPYVPTPQSVVDEMLKLGGVKEGDVVYDLGCGDGRIVVTATKKFNAKKGVGVDIDPERIAECHANAKAANVQNKVEFREGDVLKITDVSEASVVMLYLFPEVNEKLQPMLQKTLKPGSRIVSHDFLMQDNWEPEKQINIKDASGQEHTLYLWVIPTKK